MKKKTQCEENISSWGKTLWQAKSIDWVSVEREKCKHLRGIHSSGQLRNGAWDISFTNKKKNDFTLGRAVPPRRWLHKLPTPCTRLPFISENSTDFARDTDNPQGWHWVSGRGQCLGRGRNRIQRPSLYNTYQNVIFFLERNIIWKYYRSIGIAVRIRQLFPWNFNIDNGHSG